MMKNHIRNRAVLPIFSRIMYSDYLVMPPYFKTHAHFRKIAQYLLNYTLYSYTIKTIIALEFSIHVGL